MTSVESSTTWLPDLTGRVARIILKRKSSKTTFLTIRAAERTYQAALVRDETEHYADARSIPIGSLVRLYGNWGRSRNGTATYFIERVEEVHRFSGKMPDKRHGISDVQRHLHRTMDLATNEHFFSFALLCADILAELRLTLRDWGFREFNTGILQRRFEGGLAEPFATKCNSNDETYFLSLTSELKLKRLIAAGAERVSEITESFRNEGLSRVHSPEFTLLEAYGVDMTYLDIMEMVEEMVCRAAHCAEVEKIGEHDIAEPFARMDYASLCKRHLGIDSPTLADLIERFPEQFAEGMPQFTWTMKLLESVIGPKLIEPTFVTKLPSGLSPLVKRSKEDPAHTERAFLFANGYFICDIYTDEDDPSVLADELHAQAKLMGREVDAEYLECIELGIPPTAGVGLGVNRLQMLFLPEHLPHHIRETILFPLG